MTHPDTITIDYIVFVYTEYDYDQRRNVIFSIVKLHNQTHNRFLLDTLFHDVHYEF